MAARKVAIHFLMATAICIGVSRPCVCVTICCAQYIPRSADLLVADYSAAQHVCYFNCYYVASLMRPRICKVHPV